MRHSRLIRPEDRRRGVVLMVVLALLTLFAVLGLSLVLYADAEANSARIFRESRIGRNGTGPVNETPDIDPMWALSFSLGQILYDVPDDSFGVYSATRSHSLGRTAFGWNSANGSLNDKPYNGTGRLAETLPSGLSGQDSINYTYFTGDTFVRDPERLGTRLTLGAAPGTYTGGLNVSYTYPDKNNMFLGMIRSGDGQVLMPSYHRPYLFNPGKALNDISNPNWTNAQGKYLILRPRPQEMGPGFPYPTDATGDVKNLAWAPGGNDSIWMDFNAPVMTAGDVKFKMLVAPLIIDLDGRINVNVHGNIRGASQAHAGNMGLGGWEVNLAKILDLAGSPNEWQNLFVGSGPTAGRYNPSKLPTGSLPYSIPAIRGYAPLDFNGVIDPTYAGADTPTSKIQFPTDGNTGNARPYQSFPYYQPEGYNNGDPYETRVGGVASGAFNHPAVFNPFRPGAGNRTFPVQGLAEMLRWKDIPSSSRTSDIAKLLPNNLDDANGGLLRRALLTTHSFDLDRPGSPPAVWDPTDATTKYTYSSALQYPTAAGTPSFPALTNRASTPGNGDYDPTTWRNTLSDLGRVDLARTLTDYPTTNASGIIDTSVAATNAQYLQAVGDRQQFARDIFTALQRSTGAYPLAAAFALGANSPEYRANRWLAQLAVNIVDFIDKDDYMTPFQWDPANNSGEWLFGTEKPRLVLNEVFAQLDNIPGNPTGTPILAVGPNAYRVNIFAELHNPFPSEQAAQDPDLGAAYLQRGTATAAYQLLITRQNASLRVPETRLGDADAAILQTVSDWGSTGTAAQQAITQRVLPSNRAYNDSAAANNGFYVVGPIVSGGSSVYNAAPDAWGSNPGLTPTYQSASMSYGVTVTDMTAGGANYPFGSGKPTLMLRRLACQHMPYQNNPVAANYNPFITIDYVENVPVVDGRRYIDTGNGDNSATGTMNQVAVAARKSIGKAQPMGSVNTTAGGNQWVYQAPSPALTTTPQHTFWQHNAVESPAVAASTGVQSTTTNQTLKVPFDWHVHLDRQPISPMELVHVSAYKPHELTQQFVYANVPFKHMAAWTDPNTRLHRFLDNVTVRSRTSGVGFGGRVPGKVNINSIWDVRTLRALADPQSGNQFATVDAVFNSMILQRSPTTDGAGGFMPGSSDVPYQGLGMGLATSIEATLLRSSGGGAGTQRMLEPGGLPSHPYAKTELLTKIMDRLTTRSNVFAIWLTVGLFEVTDELSQPVKLGQEIVDGSGQPVRHRLFAIVDRSQMQIWPTGMVTSTVAVGPTGTQTSATSAVTLSQTTVTNPNTGFQWTLQPKAVLTYDPNTDNEETVVVQAGNVATFFKSHAANCQVISRGNPGPWTLYSHLSDPGVVLYWAVID